MSSFPILRSTFDLITHILAFLIQATFKNQERFCEILKSKLLYP